MHKGTRNGTLEDNSVLLSVQKNSYCTVINSVPNSLVTMTFSEVIVMRLYGTESNVVGIGRLGFLQRKAVSGQPICLRYAKSICH